MTLESGRNLFIGRLAKATVDGHFSKCGSYLNAVFSCCHRGLKLFHTHTHTHNRTNTEQLLHYHLDSVGF